MLSLATDSGTAIYICLLDSEQSKRDHLLVRDRAFKRNLDLLTSLFQFKATGVLHG
jgi:hypothetical protein